MSNNAASEDRGRTATVDFGVLGPLVVRRDGCPVALGSGILRQLLAVLLARVTQPVTVDALVDALWEEDASPAARKRLHVYVHRLRRQLGDARVRYAGSGYQIVVEPGELDVWRFADLGARGRAMRGEGRLGEADKLLRDALAQWRGAPYADVVPNVIIGGEIRRLNDQWLVTQEDRIAVDLALGRHAELVPELAALARDHPYREGLQGQLMLALYRSGRQAEALEVFRNTRAILVEELGVEPAAALRQLHQQILTADPALDAPTTARLGATRGRVVPAQLPSDPGGFVGRSDELTVMDRLLDADSLGSAVPVLAIVGSAGVGKTALAVHWAHRAVKHFPDGQLYVDLQGYASVAPVPVVNVLCTFLRALGTASETVPMDVAEAAAMYRSAIAGQRILVVLDNVRSVEQVRPLLPGSPGCVVIVTSRDRLDGLIAREGARRLMLDVMSGQEAHDLLAAMIGEDRVRAQPEASAELTQRCAYLPLALRVAAGALVNHPQRSVAEQAAALQRGRRLDALAVVGDADAAVLRAFDVSYEAMDATAQRVFCMVGLTPCAELPQAAVAALAGMGAEHVAVVLDRLCAAHLLHEVGPGRFGCHDLLREYAKDRVMAQSSRQEREAALRRLYNWYLHTVNSAVSTLYPESRRLPLPAQVGAIRMSVGGARQAVELLDTERSNLVALIRHAGRHGPRPMTWFLADGLRAYFDRRRHPIDLLTVAKEALAAARAEADLVGQAAAHRLLAHAYHCLGRYRPATIHLQKVVDLSRKTGWDDAHIGALANMGATLVLLGRPHEAMQHLTKARELDRQRQNIGAAAATTNNLAIACCELGWLREGLSYATEALANLTEIGSPTGEVSALDTLAALERRLGRLDDALQHATRALALASDAGSRLSQVSALIAQAYIHGSAGRHVQARDHAAAAVNLARDIDERRAEANALNVVASAHDRLGGPQRAINLHQEALEIAKKGPFQYAICEALIGLATATGHLGEYHNAVGYAKRARELARRNHLRILEAHAIAVLAWLNLATGQLGPAMNYARKALGKHQESGHRLGQAEALCILGGAMIRTNDTDAALGHCEAAHTIYSETGALPPEHIADVLRSSERML